MPQMGTGKNNNNNNNLHLMIKNLLKTKFAQVPSAAPFHFAPGKRSPASCARDQCIGCNCVSCIELSPYDVSRATEQVLVGLLFLSLNLMRDCRLHLHEYKNSAVVINYFTMGSSVVVSALNLLISAFDPGLGRMLEPGTLFESS
jgi:hypothetical protein